MIRDGKVMDRIEGHGMTIDEIAEVEGITSSGVWVVLQRAYRKLRRNPEAIAALRAAAQMAEQRRRQLTTDL